jgi:hypothetical protein
MMHQYRQASVAQKRMLWHEHLPFWREMSQQAVAGLLAVGMATWLFI